MWLNQYLTRGTLPSTTNHPGECLGKSSWLVCKNLLGGHTSSKSELN